MKVDRPTINQVFDEFLADQRERLAKPTLRQYDDVIGLLRSSLDGYAHQNLSASELQFWQRRFDKDETAGSFCNSFGPDKISENLGEFLGYFMVRKVMASKALLRAAGTVTKKLADWLETQGHIDATEAADALQRGDDAAHDLPRAQELGDLLWELTQRRPNEPILQEWEDDFPSLSRVEPGKIWFCNLGQGDDVGPVSVPRRAAELAQVGWSVSALMLGRTARGWRILEIGNVYPY